MKIIIYTPVISLLFEENNEHTLQHLNPRKLYQYSQLHYELSVFHSSLKQHCEKYLFSALMPSLLSSKSKGLWEFKKGLVH